MKLASIWRSISIERIDGSLSYRGPGTAMTKRKQKQSLGKMAEE